MKQFKRRYSLFLLALLMMFSCVSCVSDPVPQPNSPVDQQTQQTENIVLAASSLVLPEGSAFSLNFSEENAVFEGMKTALPTCANAYLNGLISDALREQIAARKTEGALPVALDTEKCFKSEDLYSFGFAVYFNLPDGSRRVDRFYLSTDMGGGAMLSLRDLVDESHFEKGTVDSYIKSYLESKYSGKYNAEALTSFSQSPSDTTTFYVKSAGVCLTYSEDRFSLDGELVVYVSNGALRLFKRNGTLSETEPEGAQPLDYQPALDGEKVVAMTFDDGPNVTTTNYLLDYLESNKIKATFFVNGYNFSNLETNESAKQCLRRAVSLGCEVGNHSYSHAFFNKINAEQRTYQLEHNADLIEAACGIYPTLFRAPGGTFPEGMPEAEDYFYIYWDADGEDWAHKNEDPQALANRYLNLIGPGSIVLFHDVYQNSVDSAIIVMNTLRAQGYRFVTVSELLDLQNASPDGTIYTSQNGTRAYMSWEK